MKKKKIILVVGARPNFIKIAPIIKEIKKYKQFLPILVHTGQHYDQVMSKVFFDDLKIKKPDVNFNVGSGTHAGQTAAIMKKFESFVKKEKPDLVLVVGDVNSTLACSLVAAKLQIKVAHVEAGLRSFDRTMPEEINRLVTDVLADYLFTSCKDANYNLKKEGISSEKIYFVGNVMIDSLFAAKEKIKNRKMNSLNINKTPYALLTLHRPVNVDENKSFLKILKILAEVSKNIPIIFPCHPRTAKRVGRLGGKQGFNRIKIIKPLGYLDFLKLMSEAKIVLTDSGGIQEETTILGVPCLTLRNNTERPVTVSEGTNIVVGTERDKIINTVCDVLIKKAQRKRIPKYWDGKTADRIVKVLVKKLK